MSQKPRYEFHSLDLEQAINSPELPEMFETLLTLYRQQRTTDERQQEMIRSLLDRIYGPKSEKSKYHETQKVLSPEFLEGAEEFDDELEEPIDTSDTAKNDDDKEPAKPEDKKRKGAHGRSKIPAHIERRVVERIDEDANCKTCDEERPILCVKTSERLEYVPPKVIAEVTEVVIRGPLACECDENAPKIVRPEIPIKPIDRGMPGVNMISSVVIGKYLYHLPHYRQATKTLKDAGITIAKQTLWDWTWRSAEMLEPLWELMHQRLIKLEYLAADETTAKMVDREKPGQATKTTYLWQYFGFDEGKAPYTVFDFARTRAHSAPKAFLGDFKGTLLTDGYSAYQCLSDEITHAGCMAHARRKFKEAAADSPRIALPVLGMLSKLYHLEKQCQEMDPNARYKYRQRELSGIMLRLRLHLEQEKHHTTPQSKIGKAITYGLNQWPQLCQFMDDGNLPIDNNMVEREMKAIATGRKNWLFFGSERGGKVAAIFYSIIASARRHDLDVWQYLADVLRRLADLKPGELEQLLPDNWKKEQAAKLEPTAEQPLTKAA